MTRHRRVATAVLAATLVPEIVIVARRRHSLLGPRTVVRCLAGHRFTTWWIPGMSLKALRFGPWRLQRCPVGRHWSVVTPLDVARLSPAERTEADHLDVRLP